MFFPVRAAPDAAIRGWLAGLGPLIEGLDHKSFRQWKRSRLGHRAFTVVRHPLLRAYVAFHDRIVSGQLAGHRGTLIRAYGARLPEPGQPFANLGAEREAFRVFLHYARLATSGQAGQRVDPHWASQTAVLQGFAAFQPLDLVIREDRLADGLAYLAAETGVLCPPPPPPDPASAGLAAILDPGLQDAAADAYARDYMGFGYGPWAP